MQEKINERLKNLGYEITPNDEFGVMFCLEKVQNKIKNMCNVKEVPKGLESVVVENVCGEFLFMLKNMGKLDEHFKLEQAISQVSEGDTSVSFANTNLSNEQRLDLVLNKLISSGEGEILCFRKFKW